MFSLQMTTALGAMLFASSATSSVSFNRIPPYSIPIIVTGLIWILEIVEYVFATELIKNLLLKRNVTAFLLTIQGIFFQGRQIFTKNHEGLWTETFGLLNRFTSFIDYMSRYLEKFVYDITAVAVEGGLYISYTMFREYLNEAVAEILGEEIAPYVILKVIGGWTGDWINNASSIKFSQIVDTRLKVFPGTKRKLNEGSQGQEFEPIDAVMISKRRYIDVANNGRGYMNMFSRHLVQRGRVERGQKREVIELTTQKLGITCVLHYPYEDSHIRILLKDINAQTTTHGVDRRPHKAYPVELGQFHSADYVKFLQQITLDTQYLFPKEMKKCKKFTFVITIKWIFVAKIVSHNIETVKRLQGIFRDPRPG
ncbi:Hexokinase [Artemisia annua]|uniref:Hexokinase n=1 Tax=Artemisia annua TaxID=35608 RepID=A0A2U1KVK6_ARTAN|nr:Hexokinase [Artemisia annua]